MVADLDFLVYLQWSDGRCMRQKLSDAQHRQYRDGVILLKGIDQYNSHSEHIFSSLEIVLARVAGYGPLSPTAHHIDRRMVIMSSSVTLAADDVHSPRTETSDGACAHNS